MCSFHCKSVVYLFLEHCIPLWSLCFKKDSGAGEGSFREGPQTWSVISMQGIMKQSTTSYL